MSAGEWHSCYKWPTHYFRVHNSMLGLTPYPSFTSFDADSDADESDAHSVVSVPPFSPPSSISGGSFTSYDDSMRSGSPTPSVWSMTSSVRAQAFRQAFGRGINNYSEVYRLAADEEEVDRLGKQHWMFKEVMGNYPPPMLQVMVDDTPGETKACLDLGCGGGHWIMDCARDFPHCSAVAVDLVPMQAPDMPPNCRSEVDDINLGLEHFYGDFNVVHAQLISSGIKDYQNLIDQISRVLRPGGLIVIIEWDFHGYDVNRKRIDVGTHELRPPWFPRWLAFAEVAARNSGGSVEAAGDIHRWILENPTFEDTVNEDFWIPQSHWPVEAFQKRIGATMRDDILAFLDSGRPLLLGSGIPEEIVNQLQHHAALEVKGASRSDFVRLQRTYARKKQS